MLGEYIAYRIGRRDERRQHCLPPRRYPTHSEAARNRAIFWFLIALAVAAAIIGNH